jgi:hypothetical protein
VGGRSGAVAARGGGVLLPLVALQIVVFALVVPGRAVAQSYAFPASAADVTHFYPTAYYDHGSGTSLRDWNCGSDTYDGHRGNDFGVGSWSGMDAGRDITAAADGVVVATHDGEYDRCSTGDCGTSNSVTIEHDDGKETIYLHMRRWTVQVVVGERVSCGQKLGEVGSSGNSTGPHLHFGVYTSSGSVRDAFSGSCSSAPGDWVSRGSYGSVPSRTCDTSPAPITPSAALIATWTDTRGSTDVNGDGFADLCARSRDGYFCELGSAAGLLPGPATGLAPDGSGLDATPDHVAAARWGDVNGDKRDDLCLRSDAGVDCYPSDGVGPVATPLPGGPRWSNTRGFAGMEHYSTLRMLDLNGDGRRDLCVRGPDGIECALATAEGFAPVFSQPILRDSSGWDDPSNYATIRVGDVNGDGLDDLCARSNSKMICYLSLGDRFDEAYISGPSWSDDEGWDLATRYGSIQVADLNGDGLDDLFGRAEDGLHIALSTGGGFAAELVVASWMDSSGWDEPDNAWTLRLGDLDADGDLDLCSRGNSSGIICGPFDADRITSDRISGPDWDNTAGWGVIERYATIQMADVNGDGRADVCGRGPDGAGCAPSNGAGFDAVWLAPWGGSSGWAEEDNWPSVVIQGPRSPGCPDDDLDLSCDDADLCPTDPGKASPGLCGCHVEELDSDADGACDAVDGCPDDPAKTVRGRCGCGAPDVDTDGDGDVDCLPTPELPAEDPDDAEPLPAEDSAAEATPAGDSAPDPAPAAVDTARGQAAPGEGVKLGPAGCAAAPTGGATGALWGAVIAAIAAARAAGRRRV